MKCDEARRRMVFFVDGEDDEVGLHVRECGACRSVRDQVAREKQLLSQAVDAEARQAPARRITRRAPARPTPARRPFIAAAAAALIALLLYLNRGEEAPPEKSPVTRARPREDSRPDTTPTRETPVREEPKKTSDRKKKDETPTKEPEKPRSETPVEPKTTEKETVPDKPKPEEKPSEKIEEPKPAPLETVEVALALETGTPKSPKWKGVRVFKSGEQIQAQTALRIAFPENGSLYLKEGSIVTLTGKRALTLESGALLVENSGPEFAILAGPVAVQDLGTRFLVSYDGKKVEAAAYEGRIACKGRTGQCELEAGQRVFAGDSTLSAVDGKGPNSYPAWMSRVAPRYAAALDLAFQHVDKKMFYGTFKDGALHGVDQDGNKITAGLEARSSEPIFVVPPRGEFWTTYFTTSPKPLHLRCRALKPEDKPFEYVVERPIVGRPVPVHVPLALFKSVDCQFLAEKDRVHIIYIYVEDSSARLRIDDIAIVERKE